LIIFILLMTYTLGTDISRRETLAQARHRLEAFESQERKSRSMARNQNIKFKQMFRSMTPPLPKNYPELKPLFLKKQTSEKTSQPLSSFFSGENRSTPMSRGYFSSESGASITSSCSPASSLSTIDWTLAAKKFHDSQSPKKAVALNSTESQNLEQADQRESVNCELRSRWLGTVAVDEFSEATRQSECVTRETTGSQKRNLDTSIYKFRKIELPQIVKAQLQKKRVLEDICARQIAINYLMDNLWVLNKSAVRYIFERLKTAPSAAYWKMITLRDCVDEVHIRRAAKLDSDALRALTDDHEDGLVQKKVEENHVEIMDPTNSRILARRRQISQLLAAKENKRVVLKELLRNFIMHRKNSRLLARRRQISQLLEARENKRLLLKELRLKFLRKDIQRIKQKRGRVMLDIANLDLNKEVQQLKQNRGRVILNMALFKQAERRNKNIKASLSKKVKEHLRNEIQNLKQKRGRVILEMADIRNSQRRNDTITARLEMSLKEALRSDLTQRLIAHDSNMRKTSERNSKAEGDLISSAKISKLIDQPGPKEFFMRTVVNKLMAKRGSKISRDWLYVRRQVGMPEQTYSKLKVNEVIKKIPLVQERYHVRQLKRKINQEIQTFGRKTAVVSEIKRFALDIQQRVGLVPTTFPLSLALTNDMESDFQVSAPVKEAQMKHASLVKQAYAEVRQIRLKQAVLMEIKVAGLKIRVNKEIRKLAMIKQLKELKLRKGVVLLAMDRIKKEYSAKILPQNCGHAMKKIVHETICQRRRKAIVCKDIKMRKCQIDLKAKVVQEMKARGLKIKLLAELRQWSLKQKLVKLAGADYRWRKPSRFSRLDCTMRRVRRKMIEQARLRTQTKKMVNVIRQIGKARRLKKEINTIIRTHFHIKQVVLEIKTRFQAVQRKDRMVDELKGYIFRIEKERAARKFSWREQRSRLHEDLRDYIGEKLRKKKLINFSWREQRSRLHKDLHNYFLKTRFEKFEEQDLSLFENMEISRQMSLKKAANQEIKQHGRKLSSQQDRELAWVSKLPISRQMSLKKIVNTEVKQYRKNFLRKQHEETLEWLGNMPISRQMALKKAVNLDIKQHRVKFLRQQHEELRWVKDMPISRQMSLKKAVNLEIKQSRLKFFRQKEEQEMELVRNMPISRQMFLKQIVNAEIKQTVSKFLQQEEEDLGWIRDLPISRQMLLKKEVNQEIRQLRLKYLVQLELLTRFRTVDLKSKLCKEILSNARTKVVTREQWPLRSKQQQNLSKRKQRLQSIPENACIVKDIGRSVHIEKISREFSQRQQQRRLKKRMLQELRMVKLKMVVCREIDLIGAVARDYRAVVQDIQALGDKARAMQQIKNKDHWLLKPRSSGKTLVQNDRQRVCTITAQNILDKADVKEVGNVSKETSQEFEPFDLGVIEERQVMLKSLVNEAVKSRFLNKAVRKMLSLRSKVIGHKSKLLSELKINFAKTKCMYEIRQLSEAKRNYVLVVMELNQRVNFAKCVRHIKEGSYKLNHVLWPTEISPVVMVKQEINLRKVNTVIHQAGLKVKLNQEIVDRHNLCSRRALAIREMEKRSAKRCTRAEFRSKVKARSPNANYSLLVQELKQRYRHKEIVKEIKTRQKQIFWKSQTCIIIRQGGNKIRVNKEIRSIARQKHLKNQINTLIKQGGLKSRLQKEIRQLRKIALLKRQKDLKAKVNAVILKMAKSREEKRFVRVSTKQTNLKAKRDVEVRQGWNHPLHHGQTRLSQSWIESQENIESDKSVQILTLTDTMADDRELPISCEKIAVMKLVESVIRVSDARQKQEKVIRNLTQEITQQRADFEALNKRVVDDKKQLYRMLEDQMRENEMLKKTLAKQTNGGKLRKVLLDQPKTNEKDEKHRQHQQSPAHYQEEQELVSTKVSGEEIFLSHHDCSFKQRAVIPEVRHSVY